MRNVFRPAAGPHSASPVLGELARLWDRAATAGAEPTLSRLAEATGLPYRTVDSWATGTSLPPDAGPLHTAGQALAGWAGEEPPAAWQWEQWLRDDRAAVDGPLPAGLTDPFALGVRRPIAVSPAGANPADPPVLPPYIPRRHDEELARVVAKAAAGRSAMAVLVGRSATGRTRACWEAVHRLPPDWRLWRPSRPEAVPDELARLAPRTVVWLDRIRTYLSTSDGTGALAAAALRALLTGPHRAPVLVLGTLGPAEWEALTRDGTAHARTRELLTGTGIRVPSAFTADELHDLERAAAADVRLRRAAEAGTGEVCQYLAGVPELLAAYRGASPGAKSLIHAAMDARRLGHGAALPSAFVEAAAPAYLTGAERDGLGEDWPDRALADPAVAGRDGREPLLSRDAGSAYRLADQLADHGEHDRRSQYPPTGFWAAAARHASPADQAALGHAAQVRGLFRTAAQLYKNAAGHGDGRAVHHLAEASGPLRADDRPLSWAAAHTALDDPATLTTLLDRLRETDERAWIAPLLRRDPATHVSLADPSAVSGLLVRLEQIGARQQAGVLAGRAAADVALGDPAALAELFRSLRAVGAREQLDALAGRAAGQVPLDDPAAVAALLAELPGTGARGPVTALAHRAAGHISLDDPARVARLLVQLRETGVDQAVGTLAHRAAAHAPLDDAFAVAGLLDVLRELDAREELDVLAGRVAGDAPLDDPALVTGLFDALQDIGAERHITGLAGRAARDAPLGDPALVTALLDRLREIDAREHVTALLRRDPAAHTFLDDPALVAGLLGGLWDVGAQRQLTDLAGRAAAHAPLDHPAAVAQLLEGLRGVGALGEVATLLRRDPAAQVSVARPAAVTWLLDGLREIGAQDQLTTLAERAAAHAPLGDPALVARLLDGLRECGTPHHIATLLRRDPATQVSVDDPAPVARLLGRLRELDARDQLTTLADRAATGVPLDSASAVTGLLDRLRESGARQQLTVLVDRLPAEGRFDLFQRVTGTESRFGRDPAGRPAGPWGWADLA
ncbi:hypothetical protein AB0F52_47655 [Amycolatopsis sp. NPDC024027]|uniref:hypothetical protein n=1 Tax=Amycolatopsis sp. NPDC024027 TaxID=3154327 RepID=UPI00340F19FE